MSENETYTVGFGDIDPYRVFSKGCIEGTIENCKMYEQLLDEMVSSLTKTGIAFFVGAYISSIGPSAIPMANPLKRALMSALGTYAGIDIETINLLVSSNTKEKSQIDRYPLEKLLERFYNIWEQKGLSCINFIKTAKPNTMHKIISCLLSKFPKSVCITTNFDELIENAYPNFFANHNMHKIHGTISKPSIELFATLHKVAQGLHGDNRLLLNNIRANLPLCFVGYHGVDIDMRWWFCGKDWPNPCIWIVEPPREQPDWNISFFESHRHFPEITGNMKGFQIKGHEYGPCISVDGEEFLINLHDKVCHTCSSPKRTNNPQSVNHDFSDWLHELNPKKADVEYLFATVIHELQIYNSKTYRLIKKVANPFLKNTVCSQYSKMGNYIVAIDALSVARDSFSNTGKFKNASKYSNRIRELASTSDMSKYNTQELNNQSILKLFNYATDAHSSIIKRSKKRSFADIIYSFRHFEIEKEALEPRAQAALEKINYARARSDYHTELDGMRSLGKIQMLLGNLMPSDHPIGDREFISEINWTTISAIEYFKIVAEGSEAISLDLGRINATRDAARVFCRAGMIAKAESILENNILECYRTKDYPGLIKSHQLLMSLTRNQVKKFLCGAKSLRLLFNAEGFIRWGLVLGIVLSFKYRDSEYDKKVYSPLWDDYHS